MSAENLTLPEIVAGLNREFPGDLIARCVLCDHLDLYHGAALDMCRCCTSSPAGAALAVRFERRAAVWADILTGRQWTERRPIIVGWTA